MRPSGTAIRRLQGLSGTRCGADYTELVEPPPDGDITLAEAKRLAAGCSPTLGEGEFRNYLRLIDVWEELSPM